MVKITYSDGQVVELQDAYDKAELRLVRACYCDSLEEVKYIIASHAKIDVNAVVIHSKRGNGTSLIVAGTKEIGKVLLENGADVNRVYDTGSAIITALDSAYKELTKKRALTDETVKEQIEEYILFLKENGGKKYDDLKEEMK
ncbi:MAG: hypothetical protein NTW78_12945 [Campylobacterales bacterium]|nr:hypothetical protein [Campylobacterales bacterium]